MGNGGTVVVVYFGTKRESKGLSTAMSKFCLISFIPYQRTILTQLVLLVMGVYILSLTESQGMVAIGTCCLFVHVT